MHVSVEMLKWLSLPGLHGASINDLSVHVLAVLAGDLQGLQAAVHQQDVAHAHILDEAVVVDADAAVVAVCALLNREASATLARLGLLRMVSCTGSTCSGLVWIAGWPGARDPRACTADKTGCCAACRSGCRTAGAVPGSGKASPAAVAGGCAPAGMLAKSSSALSLPSTACACSLYKTAFSA